MASDRQLDDAIDRAVRDIMRAEPRTGLRGRVLTEIERQPRGFVFRRAFAGAALLAVAAVLVAVLMRPSRTPAPERIAVRQEQPAAAPAAPASPVIVTPQAPPPPPSDPPSRPPATRPLQGNQVAFPPQGTVTAANAPVAAEAAVTLVSLPDSAIGTADAKTPEPPIVVPRIEVRPISVPPIAITPMLPRSR
jgi:hypothetical protein